MDNKIFIGSFLGKQVGPGKRDQGDELSKAESEECEDYNETGLIYTGKL